MLQPAGTNSGHRAMDPRVRDNFLVARLRTLRNSVEQLDDHDAYLKSLVDIILNRFSTFNAFNSHWIVNFTAGYLNDAGFRVYRSTIESCISTRKKNQFGYDPHIKIYLDSVLNHGAIPSDSNQILNIYCVVKDAKGAKRAVKRLFAAPLDRIQGHLYACKTIVLPLKPIFEHVEIRSKITLDNITVRSMLNWVLSRNKVQLTKVGLQPISSIPLVGTRETYPVFQFHRPNSLITAYSYNVAVQFCGNPKRNRIFAREKLKNHKQLYLDTFKRFPSFELPRQVQSLIELHRQQNGISVDDDRAVLEEATSEIDCVEMLRNRRDREMRKQLDLVRFYPPPTNKPGDGKRPPKGPGSACSTREGRVARVCLMPKSELSLPFVQVNLALVRKTPSLERMGVVEEEDEENWRSEHFDGTIQDAVEHSVREKRILTPTVTQFGTVVLSEFEKNVKILEENEFLLKVADVITRRTADHSEYLKALVVQCLSELPPNKLNMVWIPCGKIYRKRDACLVRKEYEMQILKNEKFTNDLLGRRVALETAIMEERTQAQVRIQALEKKFQERGRRRDG